jgi:hypothetical protein
MELNSAESGRLFRRLRFGKVRRTAPSLPTRAYSVNLEILPSCSSGSRVLRLNAAGVELQQEDDTCVVRDEGAGRPSRCLTDCQSQNYLRILQRYLRTGWNRARSSTITIKTVLSETSYLERFNHNQVKWLACTRSPSVGALTADSP